MRYEELNEQPVLSSWIDDLTYDHGDVVMTLNSGRAYRVQGVDEDVYAEWLDAPSKGRFWHSSIKDIYPVWRE